MFGAQSLAYRLKGFGLALLKTQYVVATDNQADLILAEVKLPFFQLIAMQHKIEVVLIGIDFLPLNIIQNVFLNQRVE